MVFHGKTKLKQRNFFTFQRKYDTIKFRKRFFDFGDKM